MEKVGGRTTTPSIAEGACTGPLRSLEKQAIEVVVVVGGKMSQEPPQLIGWWFGSKERGWGGVWAQVPGGGAGVGPQNGV